MTSWIDILPALPLARGVPLRCIERIGRTGWLGHVDLHSASRFVWAAWHMSHVFPREHDGPNQDTRIEVMADRVYNEGPISIPLRSLRVDLNDGQGFAYALRWLLNNEGWLPLQDAFDAPSTAMDMLVLRLFRGVSITNADRLALAKALREVVS